MQKFILVAVLVLVAASGGYYWYQQQQEDNRLIEAARQQTSPRAAPQPLNQTQPVIRDEIVTSTTPEEAASSVDSDPLAAPLIKAPAQLNDSDSSVLQVINQLNSVLAAWLVPEEQIRKWVALVNQIADGKVPVKDRPLEVALPPFKVYEANNKVWLDRSNYRRANDLIRAITEIPPRDAARYLRDWEPLLQKAQDELGNGQTFRDRLKQAIARINAVQILRGDVELKPGVLNYRFAIENLEHATAVEKMLWRLGASNTLRIQRYLRDLKPLL